jgi:hypothetical protein
LVRATRFIHVNLRGLQDLFRLPLTVIAAKKDSSKNTARGMRLSTPDFIGIQARVGTIFRT